MLTRLVKTSKGGLALSYSQMVSVQFCGGRIRFAIPQSIVTSRTGCVCVSNSVPKSTGPGTYGCLSWPTRPDSIGVKMYLLIISRNFQFFSTHFLRLFQVHRSFWNNTCFRPIALLFVFTSAAWTNTALTGFTWIHVSIRQVCVRRSISVSHSMARLPVWSLRVAAVRMTPQLRISYPLVFLPLLLLSSLASLWRCVPKNFLFWLRVAETCSFRLCITHVVWREKPFVN